MDQSERLSAMFRAHHAAIHAYAERRVGPDRAADVVADTFLAAWRRIADVPPDALPYLYAIARNTVANHRRSDARATALAARAIASAERAGAATDPDMRLADVVAALRTLGDADQEALMLVAWEDLDPARAAAAMGCSRATFAVRLHRARRRLAAALEPAAISAEEVAR